MQPAGGGQRVGAFEMRKISIGSPPASPLMTIVMPVLGDGLEEANDKQEGTWFFATKRDQAHVLRRNLV